MLALKILGIIAIVIVALFILLFVIYFFNLDMKFTVKVVAPLLEKHYEKQEHEHYV